MVISFIKQFNEASSKDMDNLLLDKLLNVLKENKKIRS